MRAITISLPDALYAELQEVSAGTREPGYTDDAPGHRVLLPEVCLS